MNQPGKSTRRMALNRKRITNLILLASLVLIIILSLTIFNAQALGLSGGAILFVLILLRIIPDLIDRPIKRRIKAERRADRGAAAEELIGELLPADDDNFVLHDIDCPYGNIDHVVFSKKGDVFLIETKAHVGRVELVSDGLLINGKQPEKNIIGQTLKNTYWLRDELERITGIRAWITPVIVFTNAFVAWGKPIKGIHVVNKKYLPGLLQRPGGHTSTLNSVWESREQIKRELI